MFGTKCRIIPLFSNAISNRWIVSVNKTWQLGVLLIALGGTLGGLLLWMARGPLPLAPSLAVSPASVRPVQAQNLQYEVQTFPKSVVYTLRIPAHSRFRVVPALAEKVDTLESFVHRYGAIAAINGGFFDPSNQKSTSYIILQGKQVADPKRNERLVNNPDLAPYLNQIFDRSEWRLYQCGQNLRSAIARHSDPTPDNCQLQEALGAGPQLLPKITAVQEGFLAQANGEVIRDSLGSRQANARSAVGITPNGDVIWVMVAQKTNEPANSGMSLSELADFMKTLGVEQAMNLDGGSSASLYYQGKTAYGKVNEAGDRVQRPIKSVLLVVKD
jgi:hypothetical protein